MTEPSKEAIEAVATSLRNNRQNGGDITWEAYASTAILAYHAHLASKGLKVTSREATEEMVNKADEQLDWGPSGYDNAPRGSASPEGAWFAMHDAAPEVMG